MSAVYVVAGLLIGVAICKTSVQETAWLLLFVVGIAMVAVATMTERQG